MLKSIFRALKHKEKSNIQKDEVFTVDYLYDKSEDDTLKKAEVILPADNQYIIINGIKEYFDTYALEYEGMSRDKKYYKISTCDYLFWVLPKDYRRFKKVVDYRFNLKMQNRKQRNKIIKENIKKSFEYDTIDEDIYNCFIAHKSGMTEKIGTWEKFNKVEEKISEICNENNGRYYKSPAKNAKFAIIFSYVNRVNSSIEALRDKGYKVTTFEKALEYFDLTDMWDVNTLVKMEKDHKKFMKEHYK